MLIQLDKDLFKWLISLEIIFKSKKHKLYSNDKYELDELTSKQMENGLKFAELLKKLIILSEDKVLEFKNFHLLKDTNSKASRLYNWTILAENYNKINIEINTDLKNLLIAG